MHKVTGQLTLIQI